MARPELPTPPRTVSSRTLVEGSKFDYEEVVRRDEDGHESVRHHVRHPGAACVLPVLGRGPDRRIVFVRNYRPTVGDFLLELPAGGLEPGEAPETSAARELVEETGYRAATLIPLGRFYTSPGLSDEVMFPFFATGLEHEGQALERGEVLAVDEVPVAEAFEALRRGTLIDGKSMLTLLLAADRGLVEQPQT